MQHIVGTVPVVIIGNNNKSDIIVNPTTPGHINFGVLFKTIQELDQNGSIINHHFTCNNFDTTKDIVKGYDLSNYPVNTTNATINWDGVPISQTTHSTNLPNGAILDVSLLQ